ncbi:MAG: hypothetical protein ACM3TR_10350 [Caulobacteraceae bacterium]
MQKKETIDRLANIKDPILNIAISSNKGDELLRKSDMKINLTVSFDKYDNPKSKSVVGIIPGTDEKLKDEVIKDDMATKIPVRTGVETSFEVEILEGLIKGDKYIVNPPEDMQEKGSVRIWGWRYE